MGGGATRRKKTTALHVTEAKGRGNSPERNDQPSDAHFMKKELKSAESGCYLPPSLRLRPHSPKMLVNIFFLELYFIISNFCFFISFKSPHSQSPYPRSLLWNRVPLRWSEAAGALWEGSAPYASAGVSWKRRPCLVLWKTTPLQEGHIPMLTEEKKTIANVHWHLSDFLHNNITYFLVTCFPFLFLIKKVKLMYDLDSYFGQSPLQLELGPWGYCPAYSLSLILLIWCCQVPFSVTELTHKIPGPGTGRRWWWTHTLQ